VTNSKDSIALLGTSADPPTCGHEALLEGLTNLFPKVITWASNNPIKQHQESLETRYDLLKALVEGIKNPQIEVIQDLSSPWTISTLEKATDLWPDASLFFIIGSDLIDQLPTWFKSKDLLKKAKIGIALREGWPLKNNQLVQIENLGGQVELLPLKIPKSSSSTVRKETRLSQIPKSILPLLISKNLYGFKRDI
tara:strand:- start:50505 stop:51089 length:585 start_codon:yes stop_codon:yes gene_type:complete